MKAIKKMEIKKVLSCFVVFAILMSAVLIFVTQSNAVMLVDSYMGKVTEKNNNVLTVQIEYKPDYSNWPPKWVSYSATSQWTISNSNAINEIRVGDYIEIAGLLGEDNEGESICIGKMKSRTEKIITDVYGDPGYLVPVHTFIEHPGVLNPPLLGNYIITYENIPDCSKYLSGSFACNVEAKYSDVTIRKENRQLKSQRLYPSQNYGYDDEEYKVDITFNSGEAPAYPDCTDQPCLGPQAFSDFTIHIKKKAEGKPDLIIDDIYWSPANPKVGDSVVITAVTKNIGSASSERCEGVIRVFDEHMPSLYFYIPELAPNEKYEESMNWKAEECGEYSVEARADYDKEIDESNEWNNRLEEMINIPCKKRPDLTVEEVRWEPENPSIGDSITFTIKVKNQGEGDAGECEAWSSIVVGSDVSICDFTFTVPSLTAGEEFTYIKSCKATECGEFYVLVSQQLSFGTS